MILELFRRTVSGFAWGGLITFVALTILMINGMNPNIEIIWLYMLASFMLGVYFGVASLIFTHTDWSPLTKLFTHFVLSIVVYFAIALPLEWVPMNLPAIVLSILIFIAIYLIFWTGFYFYFKKIEHSMNDSLNNK